MSASEYGGGELELFADASNWKAYFSGAISQNLRGRVLEVGAGLGSTTLALCRPGLKCWDCLEPDSGLKGRLCDLLDRHKWPCPVRARVGTLSDLAANELFDTIVYIDVLEHIAEDGAELALVARHLVPGGKVVILSPAFQFLFSEFDASIGHYRRYTKSTLLALTPSDLMPVAARYLDSVGLIASLANRVLLRASMPTRKQVQVWDKFMIPLSRILDRIVFFGFGRSIMVVLEKP